MLTDFLDFLDLNGNLLGPLIFLAPWLFRMLGKLRKAANPDSTSTETTPDSSATGKSLTAVERLQHAQVIRQKIREAQDIAELEQDEERELLEREPPPTLAAPEPAASPIAEADQNVEYSWALPQAGARRVGVRTHSRLLSPTVIRGAVRLEAALRSRGSRGLRS